MARTSSKSPKDKDPYLQAVRWLGYHDYSVHDLSARLVRAGFHESLVESVVARLKENGWLNDTNLARHIIEQALSSRDMGPRLIQQRLHARSIDPEFWESQWEELTADIDWLEIAEALQERYDMKDNHDRMRYGRYLLRRGFSTALVWQIIGRDY